METKSHVTANKNCSYSLEAGETSQVKCS